MKNIFKSWSLLVVLGATSVIIAAGIAVNSRMITFSPEKTENNSRVPKVGKSEEDNEGSVIERRN